MRRTFMLCLLAGCSPAAADPPKPAALYDPNPDHLWNRLHAALLDRTSTDGKRFARDTLDPQLYPHTKHLREGPSHAAAVKVLDEFLASDGEKLVRDPLKRAVMQRDLWAVFDWAAYPLGHYFYGGEPVKLRDGPLQTRLAKVIRRLALTKADAEALPDTYALAVKAMASLPPDLFAADGPWVCVTTPRGENGLVARLHANVFSGRSAFHVFIKLPEGRAATLAYLDKLNMFPKPWKVVPKINDDTGIKIDAVLNPDVPQYPAGTQVALVRQAVAITADGELVATPLTESVQFRTDVKVPSVGFGAELRKVQKVAELELRRADLFAGKTGGLHALKGEETDFGVASSLSGWADPFESDPAGWFYKPSPASKSCAECHTRTGIHGVNSYTREARYDPPAAIGLVPATPAEERKKAVAWKAGGKDWAALKKQAGW